MPEFFFHQPLQCTDGRGFGYVGVLYNIIRCKRCGVVENAENLINLSLFICTKMF